MIEHRPRRLMLWNWRGSIFCGYQANKGCGNVLHLLRHSIVSCLDIRSLQVQRPETGRLQPFLLHLPCCLSF
ncbi:hypothetical protein BDR07DRAFT_1389859 [Suillus spraguei]|nr:hypothetical protein BDR07DRAFT_1389859 [Suillus spraguei]